MPETRATSYRQHVPAVLILLAALLAAWFVYSQGLSGRTYFDDEGSLGGLAQVQDTASALGYITSGAAGALGRPVSLATFVPEAHAWPDSPRTFLRTNILIHLLNGALVTWFLYLVGLARGHEDRPAAIVASVSGAIWMLMPLLASSSLLIVQRMTTLSAAFVFAGCIGYLYGRRMAASRPLPGLLWMTTAIGFGALLAALAKENGLLILLFVLAIETTLLRRPEPVPKMHWRIWFGAILVFPAAVLAWYLLRQIPYDPQVVLLRGFDVSERLLTQAGILWRYLFLGFAPSVPAMGPFHDGYPIQHSLADTGTLIAVAGWLAAIATAVVFRRKAPLYSFALAWYLLGHSLESTTIPLELYFEHRNYVPIIGPIYALVAAAAAAPIGLRRLLAAFGAAYCTVLAAILYSVTSLWGNPPIAAEMWYIYRPESIRAAELIARQMEETGNPDVALRIFRKVSEKHPEANYLDLQVLLISCQIEPGTDHVPAVRALEQDLVTSKFSFSILSMLNTAYELGISQRCPVFDKATVYRLAGALLDNPRYWTPGLQSNLHMIRGQIAMSEGDHQLALEHIRKAVGLYSKPDRLALAVTLLNSVGMRLEASALVAEARESVPRHPLKAFAWRSEIERLELSLSMAGGSVPERP